MCKPLPGPRCSSHAASGLSEARTAVAAARTRREQAQAAFEEACENLPPFDPERRARLADMQEAEKQVGQTERRYDQARATYESTPEGQRCLAEAADRLDQVGEDQAAQQVRTRLEQARAERALANSELAASRQYAATLANPSREEQEALDFADVAVADAEAQVVEAEAADLAQLQELHRLKNASEKVMADFNRAEAQVREQVAAIKAAKADAMQVATRLYVEAGVSPRMAQFYVQDMAAEAARTRTKTRPQHTDTPSRELRMKVKPTGPDHDATVAAKAAAEDDPAWRQARQGIIDGLAAARAAQTERKRISDEEYYPATQAYRAATPARAVTARAVETAHRARDEAQAAREDLRARIASGLSLETTTPRQVQTLADEVVRNPDGTTNGWVHYPASEGFPHGRYVPVVGVQVVHGMGASNALELANGARVWHQTHYSRGSRGASEQVKAPTVHLTDAQQGSVPLRLEGAPGSGFSTYIDSTG